MMELPTRPRLAERPPFAPVLERPARERRFPRRILQQARRRGWTEDQQHELAELWYGHHAEDPEDLHHAEEEELL